METITDTVEAPVVDLDADPYLPDDWKVEEHLKGGQFKWDATKVALYLSDGQKNGKHIEGDKLREELRGQSVYNANLLDYLLKSPHLIPEEWNGKCIFFWGTIYRVPGCGLIVRCLYWRGDRWAWFNRWLVGGWHGSYTAAVAAG